MKTYQNKKTENFKEESEVLNSPLQDNQEYLRLTEHSEAEVRR